MLLLVPCFWQSRLQMGDLESHIYNAWLAQLIQAGQAPGLFIAPQKTNVLVDWILSGLFRTLGPGPAQKLTVAICVLVFVWGAFAFVSRVAGRRPWHLLPLIVALAYGWTFHMGFLNFYLSLGLCFWALWLAWTWSPRGLAAAAAVVPVAFLAHALPLFWAGSIMAYCWIWNHTSAGRRKLLLATALAGICAGVAALRSAVSTLWFPQQLMNSLGVDQTMVYGMRYGILLIGLVLLCSTLLLKLTRQSGLSTALGSLPVQIWLLTLAGVLLVPNRVSLPGYKNSLMFVAERMSLALGICLCAVLGTMTAHRFVRYGIGVVVLLFFGFLYHDERILNGIEDRIQALVWRLPPGSRVILGIDDQTLRVNALTHMIDRICVGHCYSYANYEPSTDQFRVRVAGPNPIVAATYDDSFRMQVGGYIVKDRDAPLYQVRLNEAGNLEIRVLPPGTTTGITFIEAL